MSRKRLSRLALSASACALTLGPACSGKPASETSKATASPSPANPIDVESKKPLPDPLPMIAAKVDGHAIPTSQVVVVAENALRSGAVKDKLLAYRQTLNQLVIRELLLGEAVARGIAADKAAVERAYNEARVPYKDDASWQEALKQQGFTADGFREELRAKQTVGLLLSQEAQQVAEPTENEARAFYEEHPKLFGSGERLRAAHVLVRVPPDITAQEKIRRRAQAEQVRKLAKEGADFAQLAKKWSDDATTRTRGGELEPFGRGEIMKPVEDAAFTLKPGEISDVVETQYGYHVIKLFEVIKGEPPSFEDVKNRLMEHVAQHRRQERVQALVDRLRAKARIESFL